MIEVNSYYEFLTRAEHTDRVLLLVYKPENEQSQKAFHHLKFASETDQSLSIYVVDATQMQDISVIYEIDSFPSLLVFNGGKYQKTINGCRDISFYAAEIINSVLAIRPETKAGSQSILATTEEQINLS